MAAYMPKGQYSLLNDPQFEHSFMQQQSGAQPSAMAEAPASDEKLGMSAETRQAAAQGMQSGGLSGALLQGGMASANPYAIGGGLILSQIEQAQKAKAMAEQERIANEKARMANTQGQYNKMAGMSFNV